jgi:uncharacterized protein YyaL (SSP411 family)
MRNPAVSWRVTLLAILVSMLLASMAGCSTGAETGDSAVEWVSTWEAASDRAQNENKPVMVNFYTYHCPACTALDSRTYADDELGAFLNDNVVPLKINANESPLSTYYGITAVPTVVFASPDGTEIGRFVSFKYPGRFRELTEAILSQWEN